VWFCTVTHHFHHVDYSNSFGKYCSDDQLKENEMSRACAMHGGKEECIQRFGWGNTEEGDCKT
jgi:hypothetical protein